MSFADLSDDTVRDLVQFLEVRDAQSFAGVSGKCRRLVQTTRYPLVIHDIFWEEDAEKQTFTDSLLEHFGHFSSVTIHRCNLTETCFNQIIMKRNGFSPSVVNIRECRHALDAGITMGLGGSL